MDPFRKPDVEMCGCPHCGYDQPAVFPYEIYPPLQQCYECERFYSCFRALVPREPVPKIEAPKTAP